MRRDLLQFILGLMLLIGVTPNSVALAGSSEKGVDEAFISALASGDQDAAQGMLLPGASITGSFIVGSYDAETGAYRGTSVDTRPVPLRYLLTNTRGMVVTEDYDECKESHKGQMQSKFPTGVVFRYKGDLESCRLLVEYSVQDQKIETVHCYWITPPPMPVSPPIRRGSN